MIENLLAIRGEVAGGPVGLALTSTAYNMAKELGIDQITPNISAMTEIAECVDYPLHDGELPPLVLVARALDRGAQPYRDKELPAHHGQGSGGIYRVAVGIDSKVGLKARRDQLVEAAKYIGVSAFTEIGIIDWRQPAGDHALAFAAGLVYADAQKPLDLPAAPGVLRSVGGLFRKAATERRELARLERAKTGPPLPNPFTFKDRQGNELVFPPGLVYSRFHG